MPTTPDIFTADGASGDAGAQFYDLALADEFRQYPPTAENVDLAIKRMGGVSAVAAAMREVMGLDAGSRFKPWLLVQNGAHAMRVTAQYTGEGGSGWGTHDMLVSDDSPKNLPPTLRVLLGKVAFLPPEDSKKVRANFLVGV